MQRHEHRAAASGETPNSEDLSTRSTLPGGESSPGFSAGEPDETVLTILHAHRQGQLRDAMRALATRQIQLGIVPITDEERRSLILLLADALNDIDAKAARK
jgi:hypothetical protein